MTKEYEKVELNRLEIFLYSLKQKRLWFIIPFFVLVVAIAISKFWLKDWPKVKEVAESLDIFVNFFTLLTAIIIWVGESREELEREFPLKFSPHFYVGDEQNAVMVCKYAFLSDISDIRQWAQQIGRQMVKEAAQINGYSVEKNMELALSPDIVTRIEKELLRDPDGQTYRHYKVWIKLRKLPKYLIPKNREATLTGDNSEESEFIRIKQLVWSSPDFTIETGETKELKISKEFFE